MAKKRFMLDDAGELIDLNNLKFVDYGEECCNLLNELHEENIILKKELDDVSKLLDGVSIPELLEFIKQYADLNIHFSKIKNTYVDEKRRLIGIDYND